VPGVELALQGLTTVMTGERRLAGWSPDPADRLNRGWPGE
jgi:hypothetical protein